MRKPPTSDVLVVGAGIFGLSAALACAERGLRVCVLERAAPGAGASGGPVGALAPHAPDGLWSTAKAFQLRALGGAEAYWRRVRSLGGVDPGYARCGRLMPLADAVARARAGNRAAAAARHWPEEARWRVVPGDHLPGWLDPAAAPAGAVLETLSARIAPRAGLRALAAALAARGGEIRTGCAVSRLESGRMETTAGTLAAPALVIAAGSGCTPLLAASDAGVAMPGVAIRGVKGQAALLGPGAGPASLPLLADTGLYVVMHADGTVAVGSTTERDWRDATATDGDLDRLLARARALCPALRGRPVLERWAGLRPRAPRPEPLVGPLPGLTGAIVATGGFKIGFGLAPLVGEAVAEMVCGGCPDLPASFAPAAHAAAAKG